MAVDGGGGVVVVTLSVKSKRVSDIAGKLMGPALYCVT